MSIVADITPLVEPDYLPESVKLAHRAADEIARLWPERHHRRVRNAIRASCITLRMARIGRFLGC